jgi:WD40 repeat protein
MCTLRSGSTCRQRPYPPIAQLGSQAHAPNTAQPPPYRVQVKQTLACMSVSDDVELVATGYEHAAIHLHDLTAMPRAAAQDPGSAATDSIALTHETAAKYLWGHDGPVYGLSFSCDKRVLYSCGCDGTVRLWATELGANLVVWEGHNVPVWDVAACPTGHWLATGSADSTCRLWCALTSQTYMPCRKQGGGEGQRVTVWGLSLVEGFWLRGVLMWLV